MEDKQFATVTITRNADFWGNFRLLSFKWDGTAPHAGQFFMLKPVNAPFLLSRPISVANRQDGQVSLLVQNRGKGSAALCAMKQGDRLEALGPLGIPFAPAGYQSVALVGGGVGIAPMLALMSETSGACDVCFGFRTLPAAPVPLPSQCRRFSIATEDGSFGEKGFVTDLFDAADYGAVFACGPLPMLAAVAAKCEKAGVPCFVSMEARMACGVGACLGCTIPTRHGNKRCCADGPVFPASEVFFDR
jgi:NAD(P)H-flavin reductase